MNIDPIFAAAYVRHPELRGVCTFATTVPAQRLDPASMRVFGQVLYALWQYLGLYMVQDADQSVPTQRGIARIAAAFRDHSTMLRRLYPQSQGTVRLLLTQDAQTQLAQMVNRDPIQPFDFDVPSTCLRIIAGISLA